MTNPYSMDLREQTVAAVLNDGMTCHASTLRLA
jgi:hypothetical protein